MLTATRVLLLALLLLLGGRSQACYLNLLQGSGSAATASKSIEDLAEAAPIVISGRIFSTTSTTTKASTTISMRTYSAEILVLEVLKGLALLKATVGGQFSNSSSSSSRIVIVRGFGNPISCLTEVNPDDWLILFLSADPRAGLSAHYASPSAAAAQLTSSNLARVGNALGWHRWSDWTMCSSHCGSTGIRERTRDCSGPPCDYGEAKQVRDCNRWPCSAVKPATPELHEPVEIGSNSSNKKKSAVFSVENVTFTNDLALSLTLSKQSVEDSLVVIETADKRRISFVPIATENNQQYYQSISVYLRIATSEYNDSFVEYAIDCSTPDRQLLSKPASRIILTPARVLINSSFVPWAEATRCSTEKEIAPPPTYWTAWSSCSATCGEGIRSRHSLCREDHQPNTCRLSGSRPPVESRSCPSLPLCNPDHSSGSSSGESSSRCPCQNGGFCFQSRCICPTSHSGDLCQILLDAEQPSTPPPSQPTTPTRRRSKFDCRRQTRRRHPRRRRLLKSRKVCRNGGVCDRRSGVCRCQMGWSGRRCQNAFCRPRCRNGGGCVGPNLCACAQGFYGTQCEKVECYPPCVNGGTCVQPGRCSCPAGYRGRFCHRVRCHPSLCLNGGRCLEADGLCRCAAGFYGPRCERRSCYPELSYRKTYRPVVKQLRRPSVQPCSPGSKRYCVLHSVSRVVVFKIVLRPFFTCSTT